jgi:hypothetical protein
MSAPSTSDAASSCAQRAGTASTKSTLPRCDPCKKLQIKGAEFK